MMIYEREKSSELIEQTDDKIEKINQQLDNTIQKVWSSICNELNIVVENCVLTIDKKFCYHNINFTYSGSDVVVCKWNLTTKFDVTTEYNFFECSNEFRIPLYNSPTYHAKRRKEEFETLHIYYNAFNVIVNHRDLVHKTMNELGFTNLLYKRSNLFERKKVLNHIHGMVHEKFYVSV